MTSKLTHPSIATVDEPLLVRRLANQPLWQSVIFDLHGFPKERRTYSEVLLHKAGAPGAIASDGDVDVLLHASEQPDLVIAIQVKRITVTGRAFEIASEDEEKERAKAWIRRVQNRMGEGVEQTNKLLAFGFHQIYLYVFIVVDSRAQNVRDRPGAVTYEGAPMYLSSAVTGAISPQYLHPEIGMLSCEFVQPMDYEPLTMGTMSTHLIRTARHGAQPRELTQWIASLRDSAFCHEIHATN